MTLENKCQQCGSVYYRAPVHVISCVVCGYPSAPQKVVVGPALAAVPTSGTFDSSVRFIRIAEVVNGKKS
jgi:hypothetical protein